MVSEEIDFYPFPSHRRYRYEDLDGFPDGLLVIGHAIASFNPVYGQGMSVAALEALMLHHSLVADDQEPLSVLFFDRVTEIVDPAWMLATETDFGFSQTHGEKPRGGRLLQLVSVPTVRNAHTDSLLTDAFTRDLSMQENPLSLLRPSIMWRVLIPRIRAVQPQQRDPPHEAI